MSFLKTVTLTIITLMMSSIVYQHKQLGIIHDSKHPNEVYQCASICNGADKDIFELHDRQVVRWGGAMSNKYEKQGELVVFNTKDRLVFSVTSTDIIRDFKFDGISTGLSSDKGEEIRFSIPLPQGWNSCDTEVHHIQLLGNGPPIVFSSRYYLIGSCFNKQLQAVYKETGTDITDLN